MLLRCVFLYLFVRSFSRADKELIFVSFADSRYMHTNTNTNTTQDKLAQLSALSHAAEDSPVAGPSSRPLRSHFAAAAGINNPSSLTLSLPTFTVSAVSLPASSFATPSPASPASPSPFQPHPHSHSHSHGNGKGGTGLRIKYIRFGEYDIQTWFDAPFPEEYMSVPDGRLWICEFCLKYMKSNFSAVRHKVRSVSLKLHVCSLTEIFLALG